MPKNLSLEFERLLYEDIYKENSRYREKNSENNQYLISI